MGRKLRNRLDLLYPDLENTVKTKQGEQKRYHDKSAKERTFGVGDPMYAANFTGKPQWLSCIITEKTGPVSFRIRLLDGRMMRRHMDHIRWRWDALEQSVEGDSAAGMEEGGQPRPAVDFPGNMTEPEAATAERNSAEVSQEQEVEESAMPGEEQFLRRSERLRKAPDRLDL